MKQINDDIDDANRNIRQLQDTINFLKTSADEYAFKTEDKSAIAEIKNLLSESNALKCDSTKKKKKLLGSFVQKRICWLKRKLNCSL